MNFPSQSEEEAWHERLLNGDVVASEEVFKAFMGPILEVLGASRMTSLQYDEVVDAVSDAILAYVLDPQRFVPSKGRLRSYLIGAAKNKLADTRRSREARENREGKFVSLVEVWAPAPNEDMERAVLTRQVMELLKKLLHTQEDLTLLALFLNDESATRVVGEALRLPRMTEAELRLTVKRHWDRWKRKLIRTGEELADVDA